LRKKENFEILYFETFLMLRMESFTIFRVYGETSFSLLKEFFNKPFGKLLVFVKNLKP